MRIWLVCPKCRVKEFVQTHTKTCPCTKCGEERMAIGENGEAIVFLSKYEELTAAELERRIESASIV